MGWFSGKRRQHEQEIARLREHNAQLQARVAALQAENARLLSQLSAARKHSQNSSKPSVLPPQALTPCGKSV